MSATPARFSVIVRCHGGGGFVASAIESLWGQTFGDFEIIAVDDGDPAGAGPWLDDLAARSPQPMLVVRTPSPGARAALDAGAARATAPFLAFLDGEDTYRPDRLECFARVIGTIGHFAWGFSGVEPIDEEGRTLALDEVADPRARSAIRRSTAPLEAIRGLPSVNTTVTAGNLVLKAGLLGDLGELSDLRSLADWDLALRLLDVAPPSVVERALYGYRVRAERPFMGRFDGASEPGVADEADRVVREHLQRMAARSVFVPLGRGPTAYLDDLDPREAREVRATLGALRTLRGIPLAYAAVRGAVRLLRRVRRLVAGR